MTVTISVTAQQPLTTVTGVNGIQTTTVLEVSGVAGVNLPPGPQLRYYAFGRHWSKRIVPHLDDRELNRILVRDFDRFTSGHWGRRFLPGMFPANFDPCDWRSSHRGPRPRYWRYVCSQACHWLVNFALRLALLAEPARPWRILTSEDHSTVWDGRATLFDLQYAALEVPVEKCRAKVSTGEMLRPGEYREVDYAPHYTTVNTCRSPWHG
jgi:hypothetical protein